MYLDQHSLFDREVSEEEMARISFQRQQDVNVLCGKIKQVTKQEKEKKRAREEARAEWEKVKTSRERGENLR